MDHPYFHYSTADQIEQRTIKRPGETKIGQLLGIGPIEEDKNKLFVFVGIKESIGVKGNLGVAGTHTAWEAFLHKVLNIQHSNLLDASRIHVLGTFDFEDLYLTCSEITDYRAASEIVDRSVSPLIRNLVEKGHIPIVIGGSHANAFPIIQGCSLGLHKKINVVNLDAHADFRALEGRHSGNPFSYAFKSGYLSSYSVIGLHENYNSQEMIEAMDKESNISHISWEDIYLRKKTSFEGAMNKYMNPSVNFPLGIELDLDSIENTLSSAMGPSGFTAREARQYAYQGGHLQSAKYLHLCEASASLENGTQSNTIGKLLSYLATDFIKGKMEITS